MVFMWVMNAILWDGMVAPRPIPLGVVLTNSGGKKYCYDQ